MTLRFAYLEELPVLISPEETKAWTVKDGAWVEMNYADAAAKAKLLSKAEFDQTFGAAELPPPPTWLPQGTVWPSLKN